MGQSLYFRYYGKQYQLLHLVDPASGEGLLLRRSKRGWSSSRRADLSERVRGIFDVEGFCVVNGYRSGGFLPNSFSQLYSLLLKKPSQVRACLADLPYDFRFMIE